MTLVYALFALKDCTIEVVWRFRVAGYAMCGWAAWAALLDGVLDIQDMTDMTRWSPIEIMYMVYPLVAVLGLLVHTNSKPFTYNNIKDLQNDAFDGGDDLEEL